MEADKHVQRVKKHIWSSVIPNIKSRTLSKQLLALPMTVLIDCNCSC